MTYADFVRDYRKAYEHKGGLKAFACGRLSDSWFAKIRSEVTWVLSHSEASDVTSAEHVTNWTRPRGQARQFSLLNATGSTKDFSKDHSFALEGKKLVFPQLDGIARFAKLFGPKLINLRLNGLGQSSGLGAHEERSIQPDPFGTKYKIRFHLPIYSNPSARICLDGEQFHFEEGVLYFFNQSCVHAAINDGDDPRYHFVLDCLLSPDLHARVLRQDGKSTPDPEFAPFDQHKAAELLKSSVWDCGEFVTETGRVRTDRHYGRIAPTWLDYHITRRPRLYPIVGKMFGRPLPGEQA
jgi:hypothetical protein